MLDFNLCEPKKSSVPADVAFREEMQRKGLSFDGSIIPDGNLHRFTVYGDKARSNNGWYILFEDNDFSAGAFGSWKTGEQFSWCNVSPREMSPKDRIEFQHRMEEYRRLKDEEQNRLWEECREWSLKKYLSAKDANDDHPYLIRKGVKAHRLKVDQESLIVPVVDIAGIIHGVQFIDKAGVKMFKSGTKKKGNFFPIGTGTSSALVICEGYATGASIHEATGYDVAVAFDCGNLIHVAEALRGVNRLIIIAADNDQWTFKQNMKPVDADRTPKNSLLWEKWRAQGIMENPGLTSGRAAAESIGARLVYPTCPEGTDFNDLHKAAGLNEVARQLSVTNQSTTLERLWISGTYLISNHVKIEYLIDGVLEANTTNSIFGPSGSGKSFIEIDRACHIVTGRPWNGHKVIKPGAVLYLAGEGRSGIQRRVKAWAMHYDVKPEELRYLFLSKQTLLMDGSNIDEICASVAGIDVSMVVVDTLARHLVGDENSTPDMSAFIQHIDTLRDRLKTTASIVHHTGHSESQRSRGNSSFKAALDSEIQCSNNTLTWTKTKDIEPPEPISFKLVPVEIGTDDDGSSIKSCYVEYGESGLSGFVRGMTEFEKMAIQALITVSAEENRKDDEGRYIARKDAWRDEFYRMRRKEEPDAKQATLQKQFVRASGIGEFGGGLKGKSVVKFSDDGVVLLRQDDQSAVNFSIISTPGHPDNTRTRTGHVRGEQPGQPGHTPIGVSGCPASHKQAVIFGEAGQNSDTHSEGDNEPF